MDTTFDIASPSRRPSSMGFMYILLCSDGTFYTGSTRDLQHRLGQHERGEGAEYTKRRLPVTLVYYEMFERVSDAFVREKKIQGWTHGRKRMLVRDGHGFRPDKIEPNH